MLKPSFLVLTIDFLILNLLLLLFGHLGWDFQTRHWWFMANIFFLVAVLTYRPLAHKRFIRVDQILGRALQTVLFMMLLVVINLSLDGIKSLHFWHLGAETLLLFVCIFYGRYLSKTLLKYYRANDKTKQTAIFVGAGVNLAHLYQSMGTDISTGYKVIGYFEDTPSTHLPESLLHLGSVSQVLPWLEQHSVKQLYCNLPSARSEEIVQIINYFEKHFIHFYSVLNVHNYVHRSMVVEQIDDMPVLTLRREPLADGFNRLIKRVFDLIVSTIFLVTCFWWILAIVALITKITMPGPIFFRQKRNGYKGREFYCLKFRSMRVNADADRLQATKNDPRKTKWGNIMRKTNIDELPQFLNVFLGDMSVVGPRPHMVKHTEEYSALIDKYMVRHWVKPGVTGWAQVRGARGETEHLWQMEDRIVKDVWYIENWSLWLDLRIIWLTVRNVFVGDKQAY